MMNAEAKAEPTASLESIGQIALAVQNLDAARQFYRDKLGLPHLFDAGTMSFFQCGGIRLMISLPEKPAPVGGTVLYFKMQDIHCAHRVLEAKGVPFLQPPHLVAKMPTHDLWMAFFTDPDGNTLALMCEVSR